MSGYGGTYQSGFAPRDGRPLYPSLWQGCVGAWAPCLGPSGLILRDWSGRQNHGTLTNMEVGTDWTPSGGRWTLDFDGTDYITLPNVESLQVTTAMTVTAWIYQRIAGNTTFIIMSTTPGALNGGFECGIRGFDRVPALGYYDTGFNGWYLGSQSVTLNTWTHFAMTWSSSRGSVQFFLNGTSMAAVATTTGTITHTSMDARIASQAANANWHGLLDDVRLYRRVMSSDEIRLLASRRGIAHELAPRRRSGVGTSFRPHWIPRRRLIIGAGGVQ